MTAGRIKQKAAASRRKTERRILRTRDTLGDALIALMQERNFRGDHSAGCAGPRGVGRSTFYVHYRDKDDLFLSDVEDFLERVSTALTRQGASPKRLLPVQEFFAHIRESRQFYAVLVKSGKINDVQALAHGFARSIDERLQMAGVEVEPVRRSCPCPRFGGKCFRIARLVAGQRNEARSQRDGRTVSSYAMERAGNAVTYNHWGRGYLIFVTTIGR